MRPRSNRPRPNRPNGPIGYKELKKLMKECLYVLAVFLFVNTSAVYSQGSADNNKSEQLARTTVEKSSRPDKAVENKSLAPDRKIVNNAFAVGEKLTFDLSFMNLNAGTAVLSVPRTLEYSGRQVYEINSRALSNKVISAFYPVDDKMISYIDKEGIYSLMLEKKISEGKYKTNRKFVFDHDKALAYTSKDTVSIPQYCQDILSAFYYVRTQPLVIGQDIKVSNFDNGKNFNLIVKVVKKTKIRVDAGTFNCILIEPKLEGQEFFKNQGSIFIYLTDDEKKIPVMMTSKIKFGEIAAKLIKIENEIIK